MLALIGCENCSENGMLPERYRRSTPQHALDFPIHTDAADRGASKRLDESGNSKPARDAVEARPVRNYHTGEGFVPDSEGEVGV